MSKKHLCGVCDYAKKLTIEEWLMHLYDKHELYYKFEDDYIKVVFMRGNDNAET